ncbi:integral membrane sensor signal transduction histidine kinase [Paenibacillus dendritiformis C454]|uniref:Integral membrane sensor signal transduction histidine kinase n=1 Tax=Paenibacillus dendritiformis C454 TaxID=1131935 RepID=H3SKX3_9BACL|nr:sensor histidine kinase [Paenibacillus dendritiformis]EHQ60287.1 integral membrane sensor signal transduction histidine kinase [Paenibacillus dendritiformis C454]
MNKLKQKILHWSLEKKLIAAFSCFIIVPLLLIGGIVSWVYVDNNRNTMLDAAVENNRQIMNNIDTSMQPLLRLSMFPLQESTIYQIMRKEYSMMPYPMLERGRDFDTVNGLILNGMMLYSDLIDSAIIYHGNDHIIIGRSNSQYLNMSYLDKEFVHEPFVQRIREEHGGYVPIGIHQERLLSPHGQPVVSVGRAIRDPYTKKDLGFILLNISVDKLKTLWRDSSMTENTNFYLIDEDNRIIYSKDPNGIGQPASKILGEPFQELPGETLTQEKKDTYLISSSSKLSNWKAVTVIPKHELFSIVYLMVAIMAVSLILLLVLSILISAQIATMIMKPLSDLNSKMKLVSQGQLNVQFDKQYGEIGIISNTVDNMLKEIRGLIARIYREEEEKRDLEMIALQSQIRPHFIYNTLNVIKWMAKIQGATGIEEALHAFSSVIKFTVKTSGNYVTIADEVEFIRNYTNILDYRYMNKFDVTYEIDPGVLSCKTLKFLLQPLVENAVFHGFTGIDYKGSLIISIQEDKERNELVMQVTDNGRGFPEEGQESRTEEDSPRDPFTSIGIANVRSRIELHFGTEYGLWITDREQGGTVATIRVPVINEETAG